MNPTARVWINVWRVLFAPRQFLTWIFCTENRRKVKGNVPVRVFSVSTLLTGGSLHVSLMLVVSFLTVFSGLFVFFSHVPLHSCFSILAGLFTAALSKLRNVDLELQRRSGRWVRAKAACIPEDATHPQQGVVMPLPSGRRCRSVKRRTSRPEVTLGARGNIQTVTAASIDQSHAGWSQFASPLLSPTGELAVSKLYKANLFQDLHQQRFRELPSSFDYCWDVLL